MYFLCSFVINAIFIKIQHDLFWIIHFKFIVSAKNVFHQHQNILSV